MCIKKLKILGLIKAKKFVTETLLGEKGKWTNKGNDKQQHADSLLHNTTIFVCRKKNGQIKGTVSSRRLIL